MENFSINDVKNIYYFLVDFFKKINNEISPCGVKNENLLKSAILRPYQTIMGEDAYKTEFDKGSALLHSLINNHPFHNGNKRTALLSIYVFLGKYGIIFNQYSDDEIYDFIIKIANHNISNDRKNEVEMISKWLYDHSQIEKKHDFQPSYSEFTQKRLNIMICLSST